MKRSVSAASPHGLHWLILCASRDWPLLSRLHRVWLGGHDCGARGEHCTAGIQLWHMVAICDAATAWHLRSCVDCLVDHAVSRDGLPFPKEGGHVLILVQIISLVEPRHCGPVTL